MSILTYNGITLPYANCTVFSQDPVYDDMGRVDPMYTRFEILVTSVINANYAAMYDPDGSIGLMDGATNQADNPAQVMIAIRQRLLQPRMALSFTFNGVELIPQPQEGVPGTVDANNGPVTECQVFALTNETFMVRFHVIAHYLENNKTDVDEDGVFTVNRRGNPVISNRWTEQISLDPSGYSRRTRVGRYIIRSDNPEGLTADYYREGFATCSVPPGFVRESSEYDMAPNGLGIQYRIVDREVFKLPPAPAFEASGKYIETGTKQASIRWGQVRLYLRAPKTVDQVKLIDTAIGIACTKLIARGALAAGAKPDEAKRVTLKGKDGFGMISQFAVVVDMYDNNVEVTMEVMLAARTIDGNTKQRINGVASLTGGKFMAYTPGSTDESGKADRDYLPYTARGPADLLLIAAAYFDPTLVGGQTALKDQGINAKGRLAGAGSIIPNDKVQTGGEKTTQPGEAGRFPETRKN